jgi:hypothetical protein
VLVIGVEVSGSRQREVKGGGGKQRKVATPKTSTRCSFSGLWVVVARSQPPKTSTSAYFLGWVVMVAGGWWVTRGR